MENTTLWNVAENATWSSGMENTTLWKVAETATWQSGTEHTTLWNVAENATWLSGTENTTLSKIVETATWSSGTVNTTLWKVAENATWSSGTENTTLWKVAENVTWSSGLLPTGNESNGQKGGIVVGPGVSVVLDYLGIAYIIIGLVGIFGNGISCFVILAHKPLRVRLANYFLINQCFMDLIISFILLVNTGANLGNLMFNDLAGSFYCYLWRSRLFVLGLMVSSTFSIVAVSLERYVEVVHPIRHRITISQRIVVVTVVLTWVLGILFKMSTLIPFARFSHGVCILGVFPSTAVSTFMVIYNFIGEYFAPICVITFCYIKMWGALQSKAVGPMPSTTQASLTSKAIRARRNIFKTLLTVVITFIVTWSFKQFLSLANGLGIAMVDWNGVPYKVSLVLQFSSCCLNPFIYLFQYEEFQRGLLRYAPRRKNHVSTVASSQ